jgi:hypothetical protein
MAGIAIPIAFLARDQICCGPLRGEQTVSIALFVAGFAMLATLGYSPLGPVIMIALFGMILRRVLRYGGGTERVIVEGAGAANRARRRPLLSHFLVGHNIERLVDNAPGRDAPERP